MLQIQLISLHNPIDDCCNRQQPKNDDGNVPQRFDLFDLWVDSHDQWDLNGAYFIFPTIVSSFPFRVTLPNQLPTQPFNLHNPTKVSTWLIQLTVSVLISSPTKNFLLLLDVGEGEKLVPCDDEGGVGCGEVDLGEEGARAVGGGRGD